MKKIYLLSLFVSAHCLSQISLVKDIFPGSSAATPPVINSSNPSNFYDFNGTLYFRAGDSNGQELWKSDGTAAGTVLIKNINIGTTAASNSNPSNFTSFNGQVYFTASNGTDSNGIELWKTNGTDAGTLLVKDIRTGTASANPQNYTIINATTMLFSANDGVNGVELWKTDGTEAGTSIAVDYPGSTNSITWIENLNGTAILGQIVSTTGRELYKSDGTAANSSLILDINPGTTLGVGTASIRSGSTVFFAGNNGTSGLELWKTDGTTAGTVLVKDINVGTANSSPSRFTTSGGMVYFKAVGANGDELWKSDGTAAGTVEVVDINIGAGDSSPDQITAVDGNIYFFASDNDTVYDFYKYDGTIVTKLYDFNAASSTVTTNFVVLENKIYFGADSNADNLRELWQTDGTVLGTVSVSSLSAVGINPSNVSNITKVGNKLFFSATDTDGQELFSYLPEVLSTANISKLEKLVVYPNPSNGQITTNFQDFSNVTYELVDLLGKSIKQGKWISNSMDLQVSKGMYFLTFKSEGESSTKKIIIQ